jgi:hypothetical protein
MLIGSPGGSSESKGPRRGDGIRTRIRNVAFAVARESEHNRGVPGHSHSGILIKEIKLPGTRRDGGFRIRKLQWPSHLLRPLGASPTKSPGEASTPTRRSARGRHHTVATDLRQLPHDPVPVHTKLQAQLADPRRGNPEHALLRHPCPFAVCPSNPSSLS